MSIQKQFQTKTFSELFRFSVVGVAHNLLGYLVYLLVTWIGVDPKIVVAVLYPVSTTASYFANRRWTFNHQGEVAGSMAKYLSMHCFGYVLNIAVLYIGHDLLRFPHQLVQLFAMGFLAVMFFVVSKFVVFSRIKE